MKRLLGLLGGLWLYLMLPVTARTELLPIETLSTALVDALPGYVNREYARKRWGGHLVLTSNYRLEAGPDDAQIVDLLTLERFSGRDGRQIPLLIERRIVLAPARDGRWWLSNVQTVFRPLPESLDARLGPYLKPTDAPPTITATEPTVALESAFAQAVSTWLRDYQLP